MPQTSRSVRGDSISPIISEEAPRSVLLTILLLMLLCTLLMSLSISRLLSLAPRTIVLISFSLSPSSGLPACIMSESRAMSEEEQQLEQASLRLTSLILALSSGFSTWTWSESSAGSEEQLEHTSLRSLME